MTGVQTCALPIYDDEDGELEEDIEAGDVEFITVIDNVIVDFK